MNLFTMLSLRGTEVGCHYGSPGDRFAHPIMLFLREDAPVLVRCVAWHICAS